MGTLNLPLDQLPDPLPLPKAGAFRATVRPPGSKSLTNRALLLAALARGESTLRHPLADADDAQRMLAAIEQLGATVERDSNTLHVAGVDGRWRVTGEGVTLNLNNAGTATRFLAASTLLSPAPVTIDGNERMRQRPIGELTTTLASLGLNVDHLGAFGCPPVRLSPTSGPPHAPTVSLARTQSSQFVSGLLLTGPFIPGGMTLHFTDRITSASYVRMTLELLARLGATVRTADDMRIVRVSTPEHSLDAFGYDVEADASGATYFLAAGALAPSSSCTVEGVPADSLQGDAGFAELLGHVGAHVERKDDATTVSGTGPIRPIDADMSDMPDAAMTLAVVCAFASGPSTLRGVSTLRVKECDRISALQAELGRIGVTVTASPDAGDEMMTIAPPDGGVDCSPGAPPVAFDTYDDHRMAMALALVSLRRPNVLINDPRCVEKTYPTFWADFAKISGA